MSDLQEYIQKITTAVQSRGDLIIVFIIILVGFAGFGLGRLSISQEPGAGIRIEYFGTRNTTSATVIEANAPITTTGAVVVSKNSTKYHYPWCSGAQRIKEENKIWFDTIEEARAKGYTPAANCKGLK